MFFWYIMPEWRDAGVGEAILDYQERRIHQIAAGHPKEEKAYIQLISDEKKEHTNRLLEKAGFKIVRYTYLMIRPIDDPLPDAPMPPGLDVRPVETGHYRKIWNSAHEAFNDHWGHAEPTEQDYQNWMANKYFQPELWKVAWDGDEAVGMVRNYILGVENAEYHRLRGYTEGISVRRPWRKMGIARSLLVQSIRMFKDMGMQETALRVDAENPTGALNLYAGVGYQVVRTEYTYRKAVLEAVTAGD